MIYAKRRDFILGNREPTDAECGEDAPVEPFVIPTGDKGVPHFWLKTMQNHEILANRITERDVEALKFLQDIRIIPGQDDMISFKIAFHFAPNDFFTNEVLTKSYDMSEDPLTGEVIIEEITGTEVEWKGEELTYEILEKKQSKKNPKTGKKQTRVVKEKVPCDSFFRFFDSPVVPEDLTEEEAEEFDSFIEEDQAIGKLFRDRLVPYAVEWYTGSFYDDLEDEDEDHEGHDHGNLGDDDDDDTDPVQISVPGSDGKPDCPKAQQ